MINSTKLKNNFKAKNIFNDLTSKILRNKGGIAMNKKYLLFILFVLSVSVFGCRFGNGVRGNGKVVEETRNVKTFNKIDVSGVFTVVVEIADENSVLVSAEENLMKYIRTKVKGNKLIIDTRKNISPKKQLTVFVKTKSLTEMEASGATDIEINGLDEESFKLEISGAAECEISGRVGKFKAEVSGAGNVDARDLVSDYAKLDISGAGDIRITVNKGLDADVSGAASVIYYGDPEEVNLDTSGAASVKKKNK